MSERTIQTRHPKGKSGRSISREKYDTMKNAVVAVLGRRELTHAELMDALSKKLKGKFDGNVSWYGETVKLDLEARKVVERTSDKPQRYRLR